MVNLKGQTATIDHQYVKSQADSESFSKMTKCYYIFLRKPSDANIIEKNVMVWQ